MQHQPTQEDMVRIIWGDFQKGIIPENKTLADRVRENAYNGPGNQNEENKKGDLLIFENEDNTGQSWNPPPLGQKKRGMKKSKTYRPPKAPKIKMNKAMELKMKNTEDKNFAMERSNTMNFNSRANHRSPVNHDRGILLVAHFSL